MEPRIDSLIAQLEALGYMPYQIRSIIGEAVNGANLDRITPVQADQIVECLEEHIAFAKKCKINKRC